MAARSRLRGSRSKAGKMKRPMQGGPVHVLRGGPSIVSPDPSVQHEALAARITRDRMQAFKDALRSKDAAAPAANAMHGFKALYDVMRESLEVCDSLIGELELVPPLACKSGCIHCCYNQVALTEPEALFLGFHLLETREPRQLREIETRVRTMVDTLKGKSWQDIGMARHMLPCVFMEHGNCSVYPARPLVCRGWNSVNVDMCVLSNQSEDAMTLIEHHPLLRLLAESVQTGLLQGANALGLESGYLLMVRAMSLLMEDGAEKGLISCTDDWLRGKPFFARKRDW